LARSVMYVGEAFPGGVVDTASFYSTQSLFDHDVVVLEPPQDITHFDSYKGKPSLGESASFRFSEACSHWRSEMAECLSAGKTAIVFLELYQAFFIDSGQRSYSGTGRNQKTTVHVSLHDNYKCLPITLGGITSRSGKAMKTTRDIAPIRDYWAKYADKLGYHVYFSDPRVTPMLVTKTGDKTVAGIFRAAGGGCLVLIPPIEWDWEDFVEVGDDDEEEWTNEGVEFGKSLLGILLGIDSAVRGDPAHASPPEWTTADEYALARERSLHAEIAEVNGRIELLREQALSKRLETAEAATLRSLLFASGKELEAAVVLALQTLGFSAENYSDEQSEFDIVFQSSEGRFLGEVEGKENKPINIDKLRQLEMNIQEDFQRDEIDEYAVGVLFGNAFRLTPPPDRSDACFSDKCMTGAARSGTILVRTPDLFAAARYVAENPNTKRYAKSVRQAMARSKGQVAAIPLPPASAPASIESAHAEDG